MWDIFWAKLVRSLSVSSYSEQSQSLTWTLLGGSNLATVTFLSLFHLRSNKKNLAQKFNLGCSLVTLKNARKRKYDSRHRCIRFSLIKIILASIARLPNNLFYNIIILLRSEWKKYRRSLLRGLVKSVFPVSALTVHFIRPSPDSNQRHFISQQSMSSVTQIIFMLQVLYDTASLVFVSLEPSSLGHRLCYRELMTSNCKIIRR